MSETLMETREQAQQQKLAKATFPNMLERFKGEIARALPRHLNPDRMCRIALTEFRKNPKLAECDPRSVFAAIIIASQLGLEPGVLGQAYLIPYKSECQLIPGYQGLIDLVRRSGMVQRIEAHVVRHGDKFTYKTGLHTVLEHEPQLEGTPGALRLVYAVAELKDGGYHVEVMTEDQITKIRDRSQSVINAKKYGKTTPWDTDTEEMWRKTVLRRICKFLPKSPEIATAISLDDAAAQGRQAITVEDAIAGTWQAPVLEVTTQDDRLAAKSADNLEEIKTRVATEQGIEIGPLRAGPLTIAETDPAKAEQLRAEAERQKQAVAEKFGASQPTTPSSEEVRGDSPSATAPAAAEPSAPPPSVQEPAVTAPEGDTGAVVPAQPGGAGAPSRLNASDAVDGEIVEDFLPQDASGPSNIPELDFGNAPRGKNRKR
jgi:recombination protein RecT